MKKTIFAGLLFAAAQSVNAQVNSALQDYALEQSYNNQNQLSYVRLKSAPEVSEGNVPGFINSMVFGNGANKVSVMKTERDDLGFSHVRYNIHQNGIILYNKIIVAHMKDGRLLSLNGELRPFSEPVNKFTLTEKSALGFALRKINAKKYKWENKVEEKHMREVLNQPDFSFYPAGIKTILEKEGKLYNTYQFTIYAEEPLYRAHVFVDAATGKVLYEKNLICHVNVPGTMVTKYSGTQTVTVDQNGATHRMRETTRGNGVDTYNLNNTSTYGTVDFTNTTASWTGVNADQGARDAHWGAQKTYDYFFLQHNRNSIDNQGFKLLSYVHYNNNYQNAFWDGIRMTYGDGNGTATTIFTALDVCGHEISHGLTEKTADLDYNNEPGALNESYSDIFGTCIENFGRPANWNWKMGEDLTVNNNGLRNLSNPNAYGDPDTYTGTNWYTGTADNGGVHTNSGVSNYWFYLLTTGGTGTNDLGNAYTVASIGMTAAARIAFRALTVYYTPFTDYANARALSIQAAKDLYGDCSNEMVQTTNAWHAVGVGQKFVAGSVNPNFTASNLSFCTNPAQVNFSNTTPDGLTYTWSFGDGATATSTNAVHSYTANGVYTVKLKAAGCFSALDSLTKTAYIVVNMPGTPTVTNAVRCGNGSVTLNAAGNASLQWYDSPGGNLLGTGSSFATPNISSSTTYYVVNTVTNAPAFGGFLSNTNGGYLNNAGQWLIFDVTQNSTLNSIVAYAQTAGNRTIELRDAFANVINSTAVNLAVGANTVILNYNLSPGVNYQLGLNISSASNMYRSNSNVSYPYSIGGCVNITNSSAGAGFYYWFYKWSVTKESCMSSVIPVTANVNPDPVATISAPLADMCIGEPAVAVSGSPAGGTLSGPPALVAGLFDPSVAGAGNYTITYSYTDGNNCSDTDNLVLKVSECTGIPSVAADNRLSVYPNPVTDHLTIKNEGGGQLSVWVTDASGRLVISRDLDGAGQELNTSSLAKGLYLLSIRTVSGSVVKTVKLVKE